MLGSDSCTDINITAAPVSLPAGTFIPICWEQDFRCEVDPNCIRTKVESTRNKVANALVVRPTSFEMGGECAVQQP